MRAFVDLGCGKGDLVSRVARRFGCRAVGVDRSPGLIGAATRDHAGELVASDAATFALDGFDVRACIGAGAIFGDARATLAALSKGLPNEGRIVLGEGYWRREPDPEYLASFGGTRDEATELATLALLGAEVGMHAEHVVVASEDDFDRYEWAHARGVEAFAREQPLDPDAWVFLARSRKWRESYLRWGRSTLGFAVIVFVRD